MDKKDNSSRREDFNLFPPKLKMSFSIRGHNTAELSVSFREVDKRRKLKCLCDDIRSFGFPAQKSKSVFMKKKTFSVKKIWHNLDLKVKYCSEIIKALVVDE